MYSNRERDAQAGGSRGGPPATGNTARKPRKKPKSSAQPVSKGPIPAPYLAVAPSPVSSLSQSRIDQLAGPVPVRPMILPSSFSRLSGSAVPQSSTSAAPSRPTTSAATGRRKGYAAGLLAPPAIMPGGSVAMPRIQGRISPTQMATTAPANRRRSAERLNNHASGQVVTIATASTANPPIGRTGIGTRQRSEERLRDIGQVNASMMSLGHLGQILETDPPNVVAPVEEETEPGPTRRRRRVVRGEQGLARRPTVSSREEGRALGIARGASMRRTNVWDDLPESTDPPPAFPFPTASTSRLPPAFETDERRAENSASPAYVASSGDRARSPPPSFEQAIGLQPIPAPLTPSAEPEPPPESSATPRIRPNLSLLDTANVPAQESGPGSEVSPTATQYASAPSSPIQSEAGATDSGTISEIEETQAQREDRRMWNADILAGYSLEERVRRENERRLSRLAKETIADSRRTSVVLPTMGVAPSDNLTPTDPPPGNSLETEENALPWDRADADSSAELDTAAGAHPSPLLAVSETAAGLEQGRSQRPDAPIDRSGTPSHPTDERSENADAKRLSSATLSASPSAVPAIHTVNSSESDQRLSNHELPTPRVTVPAAPDLITAPGSTSDIDQAADLTGIRRNNADPAPAAAGSELASPARPATPARLSYPQAEEEASASAHSVSESITSFIVPRDPSTTLDAAQLPSLPTEVPSESTSSVRKAISPVFLQQSTQRIEGHLSREVETASNVVTKAPVDLPLSPSGPTVAERLETHSQSGSDRVISQSPPSRKLTRGKAVRRSPTIQKHAPIRTGSIRSKDPSDVQKPLFSSPGFTAAQLEAIPAVKRDHRMSAPNILGTVDSVSSTRPVSIRDRFQSHPDIRIGPESAALPPHREAALKRRESALGRMQARAVPAVAKEQPRKDEPIAEEPSQPIPPLTSQITGPLIDLTDAWPSTTPSSPPKDLRTLAATTAELLQLLEDNSVAESSAQGAAKAEVVQAVRDMITQPSSEAGNLVAPKKKAPPPPPPVSLRSKRSNGSIKRKLSILSSADTPLTPRPTSTPSEASTITASTITADRAPAMPTRRPPPPPPTLVTDDSIAPPLPPRPDPPAFQTRPDSVRRESSAASVTDSSLSEGNPPSVTRAPPAWSSRPRTSLGIRPKGPRPPPIPPRPWAKVVSGVLKDDVSVRPSADRTLSDNQLVIETHVSAPSRSMSAQDLTSAGQQRQSPEYTDLDVFVSRLEGSGREYEGYAHLTSFLGPAKNPAASPAALATLLPGLVQVDSRRTNAAGKVKLKLSLLGVRVVKCPICLSQFRDRDKAILLPICGHAAHETCGTRWFRENKQCFVCRVALEEEDSGRLGEGVV